MESILTSVKKVIGVEKEYNHFDPDIIMHINAAFATLTQLGVGPKEGFMIHNSDSNWDEFLPSSPLQNFVRQYIQLKVKMGFDPTASSQVGESINMMISELEWRIREQVEFDSKEETEDV